MGNLVSLLITIGMVYWAVTVSKNNGKNPVLWGILTFLFGLLPLSILHFKVKKTAVGVVLLVAWIAIVGLIIAFAPTLAR